MATLGLKEMGKFLWEGREKSLPSWLSQFSFAKWMGPYLIIFSARICASDPISKNIVGVVVF